ncbi:MAG TPA: PIN domain-containing protein [Aggregatilineales bacterium]|nr:PIN domain-containing protein [Aggregatilineales bacterium]
MTINILLDSSFLFALNSPNDEKHLDSLQVSLLKNTKYLIPDVALTEVTYLMRRDSGLGQKAVLEFLKMISTSSFILLPVIKEDIGRACEVMSEYSDAKLDFVDCCIFALAERLKIIHICTFDMRDFRMFRPKHVNHFTLLPVDLPQK